MARTWKDGRTGARVSVEKDVHGEEGVYWLTDVRCPASRQGEGGATRVMQRVCGWADREGFTLRLMIIPKPNTEVRKRILREWYTSFGFRGIEEMVRDPLAV